MTILVFHGIDGRFNNSFQINENEIFGLNKTEPELIGINKTEPELICDDSIERLFNESVELLNVLKEADYIPSMNCPKKLQQFGWRPPTYTPMIFGNLCEPWWERDAVFILSRILNKKMLALEYGSGTSSIWLALHVRKVIAIEALRDWIEMTGNLSRWIGLKNLDLRYFKPSKEYDHVNLTEEWIQKGIDFVSNDGSLRMECMQFAMKHIKKHGGIILLDNSDREKEVGQITPLIPKHWIRYDSKNLKKHINDLETDRWLENAQTTIFITRHPKCLQMRKK